MISKKERASRERYHQRLPALTQTTMPSSIPPEIADLILDQLRDEPATLKACCVVSKSWVPRARIHLFASVEFHAQKSHIELWKKTFPDPSNSPAHHTRSLAIRGIPVVTAADTDSGGWIRTFHNLVHLRLEALGRGDRGTSLAPFHGLSPTLRSLRLKSASTDVLDLVCSFPLLEDLAFLPFGYGGDTWSIPATSPKFTGSLNLDTDIETYPALRRRVENRHAIRRLLDLPDGLHFVKIRVGSLDVDVKSTTDLVSRCSDTLESLSIYDYSPRAFLSIPTNGKCLTAARGSSRVTGTGTSA
jgi:hypothetical protein